MCGCTQAASGAVPLCRLHAARAHRVDGATETHCWGTAGFRCASVNIVHLTAGWPGTLRVVVACRPARPRSAAAACCAQSGADRRVRAGYGISLPRDAHVTHYQWLNPAESCVQRAPVAFGKRCGPAAPEGLAPCSSVTGRVHARGTAIVGARVLMQLLSAGTLHGSRRSLRRVPCVASQRPAPTRGCTRWSG